ncbi:MAG TPA: D-alanyl-D-alanine carboxypeptidase family protein [Patescibacteria group bacterium]|nr:D-alanyl-D-alanine carboxypeptidase family protein [Patescibacteria group bacterium]
MKNNLLYLSLLSFLLISTSALSLSNNLTSFVSIIYSKPKVKTYSPIPVLKDGVKYPILSSQSVMAVDLVSGVTLYEKDSNKALLPASTTKIVTALVALDSYELNQVLKVGAVKVEGQKMGLVSGEEIMFSDLLSGLLIYSANDAAEVLASNYPGGRELFIDLMNKKVKDLGLTNTHFGNPTGLDNGEQYTTTRDLIVVSKYAMKNPIFAELVGTKEKVVKSVDGRFIHRLININKLLGKVEGVTGVKTGWTENARENLVTEVNRDGKKIMIVVLGSSDRFGETTELINWIYGNYIWEEVKPT